METLKFDLTKEGKPFKILNATNGGPMHKRHAVDQQRSNLKDYKAARIPYSRNHDSGVLVAYGGPYSHDVSRIFPNFDADPYDPNSYDFACTDEAILATLDAGTKTYFRLGETIEHQIKKHATLPPKDFHKWAVICEHIIRHYTEGWADGFTHDMQYWEIWNEPNLQPDDSTNKQCWGGTMLQFFDFYEIAAKHLKKCFPHLKIGGPALVGSGLAWASAFLQEVKKREIPLDFFSWHQYSNNPDIIIDIGTKLKKILIENGFGNIESILSEWNYNNGWESNYMDSVIAIHGIKGAAFTMMSICKGQESDAVDMMMYYDTRPSTFNGAFDYYTLEPLKGYYPLYWYGMFYDMKKWIPSDNKITDVASLCGLDENGKVLCALTYYHNDERPDKTISLDFGKEGNYEIYMLDEEHSNDLVATTSDLTFNIKNYTSILIKEI